MRVVSAVSWSPKDDALDYVSTNVQLVIDLDLDGCKADSYTTIRSGTFSLHQPNPAVRDRYREFSFILLSQCRPCLPLDLLMALQIHRRFADRQRLERVRMREGRRSRKERVMLGWRAERHAVDVQQGRCMKVHSSKGRVRGIDGQMRRALRVSLTLAV